MSRTLTRLGVISMLILTSCATTYPTSVPTMEVRQRLGTMAIIPAQYVPRSNFAAFAKSKPAGAAKGAAEGAAEGAAILGVSAVAACATNPYAALIPMFVAVGAALGAVAGAGHGVMTALREKKAEEIESAINAAVSKLDAQHALARGIANIVQKENWIQLRAVEAPGPTDAAATPSYGPLGQIGIDTVLEVAVTEIGFEASGCGDLLDPYGNYFCRDKTPYTLIFFMRAKARLVRVSDGTELFAREFRYRSPWREAAKWMTDDGRLIAEEFENAYQDLSEKINDEMLLITPIALPTPSIFLTWGNPLYGACWLTPIYPKVEGANPLEEMFPKSDDRCLHLSSMKFGLVDSQRPTLRWSNFPRDLDCKDLDPELLGRINDVTYDLMIWEVEGCERAKLVYERTGLSAAEHELEEQLKPDQRYFWSFRARFTVDGQPMATRWAFFDPNGCYPDDIADRMYYRFETPK